MATSTLRASGARHFVTRKLGMNTVELTVGGEAGDVIAVGVQLAEIDGLNLSEADSWVATIVGEPAADYTCAETGAGTEISVTGHTALAFTLDANGAAEISVTDVGGASGETVVLKFEPLDGMGVPAFALLTFD